MQSNFILFIIQSANFQSRSLLVPYEKFLSVEKRLQDYNTLKKFANNGVLYIHYSRCGSGKNNLWSYEQIPSEYSEIINDMRFYAEWARDLDEGISVVSLEDEVWAQDVYRDFCDGFSHVENYKKSKEMTTFKGIPVNIVDSFLVLESFPERT